VAKKKPKKHRKHSDRIRNLWTKSAPPVEFGRERFHLTLHRKARRLPTVNLDDLVETFNWERAGSIRSGELNFYRPLKAHVVALMAHGDEVRCSVSRWDGGPRKRVWRMKVVTPQEQLAEGLVSLALSSSLDTAAKSKAAFKFRKGKRHPHGWNAKTITLAVAHRFHIPLGHVPEAHFEIHKLIEKSMSPIDVIAKAWRLERTHTGRRFDIDTSRDVIDIRELREPRYMLLIGERLMSDGTVTLGLRGLCSAVIVHATVKRKGKRKPKHLRVKVVDHKRVRRYGYIVRTVKAPKGHDTDAELRHYGRKWLARRAQPHNTVDFTMPGIPWLDRGDAVRIYLRSVQLHQRAFVTSARHDVSAGSYTMDLTVGFTDPWVEDIRKAKAQRKKEEAARRRKRRARARARQRGDHSAPKPKKARKRAARDPRRYPSWPAPGRHGR
jgi:hypothetical protein